MIRKLLCALLVGLLALAALPVWAEVPEWFSEWGRLIPLDCEPVRYLAAREEDSFFTYSPNWLLLNENGDVLEEDYLDRVDAFYFGVAPVKRNDKWGYLRSDGEYLVEPRFDEADEFYYGCARVCLDGKYGYVKLDGEYLVEPRFDEAGRFSYGCAVVCLDGKYGFVQLNGEYLAEPQFYMAYSFVGDYAVVAREGDCYVDDLSGGSYIPPMRGVIDRSGALLIPMEYDSIEIDLNGVATATLDGETTYFQLGGGEAREIAQLGSGLNLEDYYPNEGTLVAELSEPADIAWDDSAALPRLDGATALFPVYAAAAQATYPEETRYGEEGDNPVVTCTKTNRAYERLIEGSADVIFCAEPSDEQLADAAAAGVELELTPFGREAFVFIVNQENPLAGITTDEIRGIYSGAITDWAALDVDELGEIVAYQRPKNSGSQTALEALMGDVPLMTPPQEHVADFMDDILENVEYRNLPNAIGYSFRFYCTEMEGSGVKLLNVDGVAPTVENIRSGAYPHVSTLYCVTRKGEENPNVQVLVDWMTSGQGQALTEASGYVSMGE